MKKIFCLILVISLCFAFTGCSKEKVEWKDSPWSLIEETTGPGDYIIQQTFYNKNTEELLIKDFIYELRDKTFICVDQKITIINPKEKKQNDSNLNIEKIYYTSDIRTTPNILMDNEYVKISITKYLTKDNWWEFGYELKVFNKTNDVITITINDATIMNINCKPMFSVDHIDAGNTAYFTLAWDLDTLANCYIPYIDNVAFTIKVFDNENWNFPALAGSRILIKK